MMISKVSMVRMRTTAMSIFQLLPDVMYSDRTGKLTYSDIKKTSISKEFWAQRSGFVLDY